MLSLHGSERAPRTTRRACDNRPPFVRSHRERTARLNLTRSALPSAAGDIAGFPARITALGDAFAHVHAFCARNAIAADDALRLKLVVEELFTNTVKHGYGVESDAPIRIQLEATADAVELVYEDEASPFDPTTRFDSSAGPVAVDANRPVGGLGLRVLGRFVQDARYQRRDGRNRLWLRLAQAGQRGALA